MSDTSKKSAPTKIPPRIGEWSTDSSGEITLFGSHCTNCQESYFPAHEICVRCGSEKTERLPIQGPATLRNFTVVHQLPAGFTSPWIVGYGVFEGQVVVLAPIVDTTSGELSEGTLLTLKAGVTSVDKDGDEFITYQFAPLVK